MPAPLRKITPTVNHTSQPNVKSPCFVHSHLDKGGDLLSLLHNKHYERPGDLGVAKSLQQAGFSGPTHTRTNDSQMHQRNFSPESVDSSMASGYEEDDEDEHVGSLTTRLAETAVGVREMSKQLGELVISDLYPNPC